MRNGKEMNSCLFGEELVAYIYGELPAAGRKTFERHLLDCSGCTAEMADISFSRLGVYEWHRDEFVPLETPQFVIPYEAKSTATPKLSWVDALRGLVSSPFRLATAGGAFAVIAFALIFGFEFNSTTNDQIANVTRENTSPVRNSGEIKDFEPDQIIAKQKEEGEVPAPKREFRSAKSEQRVQAVQIKNVQTPKRATVRATNTQSPPRLGNFVETEDKSLRLADLVADIDTRD